MNGIDTVEARAVTDEVVFVIYLLYWSFGALSSNEGHGEKTKLNTRK